MASKALKGLTIKIGGDTSGLLDALKDVEKRSSSLSSELGQINKLLKLDPKNTELLAQKQKVLADAISNTEKKLGTLKEAERQAQEQFAKGNISEEQYRALQREVIATEKKLDGYKKAAQETSDAVEELGDESKKAADKVEDQEKAAKDGAEALEKLKDGAATAAKVGFAALAAAAVGAVAGIKSVVEETADYRNAMAKLDTAFEKNGHSTEAATETYKELQSVLGDTDQAVEAANFIAKLTKNEKDLSKWTEVATGVYGEFGDSLPIEGLMEAANETAKVGQVTGPLADALNWAAEEGENFGVVLKKNIEFTKLSDKELENLTEAERKEYEAKKKQYEAIEEYNKKVEEATSAEDLFNIALSECTTEQERQQLILDTLTGKYSDAAENFKETNKEVIEQNKATERLNELWAKVGKKAAPIVTTFTEGIADLVEALLDIVEDVDLEPFIKTIRNGFKKIAEDVLPKLIDALKWCVDNWEHLKSVALGFIAALAVMKIASFANMIYTKLIPALTAGTAGFTKMNAAALANPYVALAAAIAAVCAIACNELQASWQAAYDSAYAASEAVNGLTEAEKEMTERAIAAGDAFRNQRTAFDETVTSINSQFDYLDRLKTELFNLADASGRVQEKDEARAQFILDELNEAMGTEYQLVGDQIEQYDKLATSIKEVILQKKTEMLLEASKEEYIQAVKEKKQAEEDYYAALAAHQENCIQLKQTQYEWEELMRKKEEAFWPWEVNAWLEEYNALKGRTDAIKDATEQTGAAFDSAKETLEGYYTNIGQYETAQTLMLQGNTAEAERILSDRGYYMEQYADRVGFENDQILNTWELNAASAGVISETIKTNWENGVEGYTDSMVKEAEDSYTAALDAYDDAYNAFYGVGSDMSAGLDTGWNDNEGTFIGSIVDSVTRAVNAAKNTAAIKSPSRKMRQVGDYMGQGLEVGIEETTPDVEEAAAKQAQSVISAYDSLKALDSQNSLKALEAKEESRAVQHFMAATNANVPVLEKILTAIEEGHILTIDSNALVGATANKMDSALGVRRALTARGAI